MNTTQCRASEQKRSYVRTTIQQRKNIVAAFREHGDDKPPVWYAATLGITLSNVTNLLVKVRRGESITPKGYYHRKSLVVPLQHLVRREVELDPTVPMQVVLENSHVIVEVKTLNPHCLFWFSKP